MSMTKTDIIIIGSGPGGYRAALHAALHGKNVVIAEAKDAGGTCLNYGCIPTKTLCKNAEIIDTLRKASALGLENLSYDIDYAAITERKNNVVSTLRSGVEQLMKSPGITFFHGFARFKGPKTVEIGDEEYTADNVIIATGSRPKTPPIEGTQLHGVLDSTGLLAAKAIPQRLCIIGAGVIGMEFASIFSSFGSKVTVIEYLKEALPSLDSDIAKRLRQTISKRGVEFFMQSCVQSITRSGSDSKPSLSVLFERKGKQQSVEADAVMIATGRAASTDGLGLDEAGISTDGKGIVVDDNFMTNIDGVYAIGDVNGRCLLAHAATYQGLHVVNRILGKTDNIRFDIMPSAIFTHPEAACVGLSEDRCKELAVGYECRKGFYRSNGKALAMDETDGMVKLMVAADGRILGCHAFGAHASDLIQEVAILMNKDATAADMADIVYTHPTLSEILHDLVV